MGVHRVASDPEARGNFFVGEVVIFSQDEHFAAALGQGADRGGERFEFEVDIGRGGIGVTL